MKDLKRFIATTIREYLNENHQVKSTNNFEMFELLKTLPFIKYVDRPMGRFLHSIDLVLVDENNIDDLKEILDKNNWYIERGRDRSFTITQKYVDDAKIEIPKLLYHTTPTKNIESILKYGLKPKSEDLRHKYPPSGLWYYDGKSLKLFTINDGLPHNHVMCIVSDKEGNIWFGTRNTGLCRYDGKTITNYSD